MPVRRPGDHEGVSLLLGYLRLFLEHFERNVEFGKITRTNKRASNF